MCWSFHFLVLQLPFKMPSLSSQNVPQKQRKNAHPGGDFDGADGSTVGAFQGQCHGDAWHRHCNLAARDSLHLRFPRLFIVICRFWDFKGFSSSDHLCSSDFFGSFVGTPQLPTIDHLVGNWEKTWSLGNFGAHFPRLLEIPSKWVLWKTPMVKDVWIL